MGGPGSGGSRSGGSRRDEARRREVAGLRANGLTLREIGERFGITRQAVDHLLKDRIRRSPVPKFTCRACRKRIDSAAGASARGALCLPCLAQQPDATFAVRLKACRVAAGLSRPQLERRAELRGGSVCVFESGKWKPSYPYRDALARALGPTLAIVLLGAKERENDDSANR